MGLFCKGKASLQIISSLNASHWSTWEENFLDSCSRGMKETQVWVTLVFSNWLNASLPRPKRERNKHLIDEHKVFSFWSPSINQSIKTRAFLQVFLRQPYFCLFLEWYRADFHAVCLKRKNISLISITYKFSPYYGSFNLLLIISHRKKTIISEKYIYNVQNWGNTRKRVYAHWRANFFPITSEITDLGRLFYLYDYFYFNYHKWFDNNGHYSMSYMGP